MACSSCIAEAEAAARGGTLKDQGKAGRAMGKIVKSLTVGDGRIGLIDALRDDPWRGGATPGAPAVASP